MDAQGLRNGVDATVAPSAIAAQPCCCVENGSVTAGARMSMHVVGGGECRGRRMLSRASDVFHVPASRASDLGEKTVSVGKRRAETEEKQWPGVRVGQRERGWARGIEHAEGKRARTRQSRARKMVEKEDDDELLQSHSCAG